MRSAVTGYIPVAALPLLDSYVFIEYEIALSFFPIQ